jgi:ABC-type ATPase involved in cell division/GNAT superfamily N-acetyltransferase
VSEKIEVCTPVKRTGRVMQVEGMFDVPKAAQQTFSLDVNLPHTEIDWNVGLIVGPSGSGKSTVARHLWPDSMFEPQWSRSSALLDDFPKGLSVKDVVGLLTAVGLGSPPAWLRPYHTLSTGEQFRAQMARVLAEKPEFAVVDEFTSTVDRQVARVCSHAVQKAVRRREQKLVAVTCHFDLIDWLQPDWVYRPDTGTWERRHLQRHPPIELRICEVPRSAWPSFSRHHYLSHVLHNAAHCYGAFIGEECVAFNCHIPFPHPKVKNIRMGHRLVVLPDYQGLGIGGRFDDWLGQHLYEKGYRYHKTISHPALIRYFMASPRWLMHKAQNRPTRGGAKRLHKTMQSSRKLNTRSFSYVPVR